MFSHEDVKVDERYSRHVITYESLLRAYTCMKLLSNTFVYEKCFIAIFLANSREIYCENIMNNKHIELFVFHPILFDSFAENTTHEYMVNIIYDNTLKHQMFDETYDRFIKISNVYFVFIFSVVNIFLFIKWKFQWFIVINIDKI